MTEILNVVSQLGIAGLAIWIIWKQQQLHAKRMEKREKSFDSFVLSNNHKVTDLVKESTESIKESSISIKRSNEIMKDTSETLKEIKEYFEKQK